MAEPLLEARGLVKHYGHVLTLDSASFTAYPGEVVALIGDNGAGKSSLVKTLSEAIRPDRGEILVEGRAVQMSSPLDARRYGIETVYQDLALAPDLDAAVNLHPGSGRFALRSLARCTMAAGETWVFAALIVMMAIFTGPAPGKFLTTNDLSLISQGAAPFLVMAIGETFVILTAGIDLSVGLVLVLSGVVAGQYYVHNGGASAGAATVWIGVLIGQAASAASSG